MKRGDVGVAPTRHAKFEQVVRMDNLLVHRCQSAFSPQPDMSQTFMQ
ncbi:MAG: hypothetical protein H7X77_05325 [Anaerolineae bacterium]|nr:hypothetical protein [Anaerolineae bacterium]